MKEIKEERKQRRAEERNVIGITKRMKKKIIFINCNRNLKSPSKKYIYINKIYT